MQENKHSPVNATQNWKRDCKICELANQQHSTWIHTCASDMHSYDRRWSMRRTKTCSTTDTSNKELLRSTAVHLVILQCHDLTGWTPLKLIYIFLIQSHIGLSPVGEFQEVPVSVTDTKQYITTQVSDIMVCCSCCHCPCGGGGGIFIVVVVITVNYYCSYCCSY